MVSGSAVSAGAGSAGKLPVLSALTVTEGSTFREFFAIRSPFPECTEGWLGSLDLERVCAEDCKGVHNFLRLPDGEGLFSATELFRLS